MHATKLFKKFLLPCGLCAAVPVIKSPDPPQPCSSGACKRLTKPSELPLYSIDEPIPEETSRDESPFPALEEKIHNVRMSVKSVLDQYLHLTESVTSTIDTGIAHTKSTVDYLRDEENLVQRIGAIGAGGLLGLIMGVRGGKFKKLVYTSIGAGGVGAIVCPKEALEALNLAEYYANVGYNFLVGVKPGTESQQKIQLKFELPKMLSTGESSDFLDIIFNLAKSAACTLGNLAGSAYKAVTETGEEKKEADTSKESK